MLDRSSVSERLRAAIAEAEQLCDKAHGGSAAAYFNGKIAGLIFADALLSAEVPASTGRWSMTFGELPDAVRMSRLIQSHEWDNKNISEQRDWAVAKLAAALPSPPTPAAPLTQEKKR